MDNYTRLSSLQAAQPEFAIFRRYMPLQALQLNVLQGEIAHLRQGLGLSFELDRRAGDNKQTLAATVFSSLQLPRPGEDPPQTSTQKAIWDRLDATLEKYSKALLRYHALSQLPSADPLHHEHLRFWNSDLEGGQGCFSGVKAVVWDAENAEDLTSIAMSSETRDPLTALFNARILPWYHSLIGHKSKRRVYIPDAFTDAKQRSPIIYHYSDKRLLLALNICSTVLASMVPALSSLALYFIQRECARMGAIVGFTFFFSVVIVLITPAKRIETFVATAAFAAVLIVFVGNGGST